MAAAVHCVKVLRLTRCRIQNLLALYLFRSMPSRGNKTDKASQMKYRKMYAGGKVGLIDYGQSKQLEEETRVAFARLVLEMTKGKQDADPEVVSTRLQQMGLQFDNDDNLRIQAMMAFGMFDTELSHR